MQPLTAVLRYCEKSAKLTFIFRKKLYFSRKYAVPKLATDAKRRNVRRYFIETPHKKMETNIIYNPKPRFETEYYLKKRKEIFLEYYSGIKNTKSIITKSKFWILMQIELLKFSPLINLYFGKNKKK